MQSDCYFEECKNCVYKEHSNDLLCCIFSRLGLAHHKLYLEIPIINKFIEKNKQCNWYMEE